MSLRSLGFSDNQQYFCEVIFQNIISPMKYLFDVLAGQLYNYTRVPEPSRMTANYEKCMMVIFLSTTLLNTNRK